MTRSWDEIWERRSAPTSSGESLLRRLMDADGLDSGFARVEERDWRLFAESLPAVLGIAEGESVFEVGCGAGALLLPLSELGHRVAGLDISPALVDLAASSIPGGHFTVCEASELDLAEQADVVVSMGVFLYFRSQTHAERVLDGMVEKARRAVAVLDLPDARTRSAAIAERERVAGGAAAYRERYAGLDHRYYERAWVADALRARGLERVEVTDQSIAGYGNAPYRFNAWGFKPSPD